MKDLNEICRKWLDNADLDIKVEFGNDGSTILLVFYVVGVGKKVLVTCKRPIKFSVEQDPDDLPMYVVFETSISLKKKNSFEGLIHSDVLQNIEVDELWHVDVSEGDAKVLVVSEQLSWEIFDITVEERSWYTN
ncbi:hypothetical protein ACJJIG_02485 [Microbulbifer sp. SSSA007]|uniref:hypothetical protein n=1 Tax=Microbulbifer sp. SSSA007 TaxID=3243379 RepID=UPI00403A5E72